MSMSLYVHLKPNISIADVLGVGAQAVVCAQIWLEAKEKAEAVMGLDHNDPEKWEVFRCWVGTGPDAANLTAQQQELVKPFTVADRVAAGKLCCYCDSLRSLSWDFFQVGGRALVSQYAPIGEDGYIDDSGTIDEKHNTAIFMALGWHGIQREAVDHFYWC